MGPQLYRCGNSVNSSRSVIMADKLQWGRNFIVAEISGGELIACGKSEASMGPQLYRCGNTIINNIGAIKTLGASMGPQLYRCGNYQISCKSIWNTFSASMGPQLYRCGNKEEKRLANKITPASMGPQLYRCGNKGGRE